VRITELPVGVWTKDYKAFLEELLAGEEQPRLGGHKKPAKGSAAAAAKKPKAKAPTKAIGGAGTGGDVDSVVSSAASTVPVKVLRDYQANYNDVDVDFVLTLDPEYYVEAKLFPTEFEKRFKLTNSHSLSNMVAFGVDGILRKFASAGEIMEAFYGVRLVGYTTRKANELARLDAEIVELDARVRFVRAVVAGTLKVANAADEELLAGLIALDLPALSLGEGLRGFEYLLRMRVDRLKAAAVIELQTELVGVRATRATLEAKSPEMLWLEELDGFSAAYEVFVAARAAAKAEAAETSAAAGAASGGKKRAVKAAVAKKA
jgi:DNA topoisomerase-2